MPVFDFGEKRSGNTPVFDFGEWCEQGIGDDGGEADGGPICASNSTFRPQVIRTFMLFAVFHAYGRLVGWTIGVLQLTSKATHVCFMRIVLLLLFPAEDAFSVRGSDA